MQPETPPLSEETLQELDPFPDLDPASILTSGARPWIGFLTCPELPKGGEDAEILRSSIEKAGASCEFLVWSSPGIPWGAFDALVPLYVWDYSNRPSSFRSWLIDREREGVKFINPTHLIRWNIDKAYLLVLQEEGIPMPVTLLRTAGMTTPGSWSLDQKLVIKPRNGAGGLGVEIIHPEDWIAPNRDLLVQPYHQAVTESGELSVIMVDGRPLYAVRRYPAQGDFRVQDHWGGHLEKTPLDERAKEAACKVADLIPGLPAYCRIDFWEGVKDLLLVEVEIFEPDLSLRLYPDLAEKLAHSLVSRASESMLNE